MPDYYSDYYFTSNRTQYLCPTFSTFQCQPPKACARDPQTGKFYCCDSRDASGNVCWSIPQDCATDGSTLTCGHGDQIWCCRYQTEECTSKPGQFNICWNKVRSTLGNISEELLQDTYSSLSAATPLASSWVFDPATLMATATHTGSTSSSPSTSASQIPDTTATATSSPPSPDSSPTSLSGGGIAGIVVGVVAVVAIALGAGMYLLKRHRRRVNPTAGLPPTPLTKPAHEAGPGNQVFEVDGERYLLELPGSSE
ncbi:uncharacterized protein CDV56_103374 [Aspergillus thermomutatus]|uniref:Uncharacterized protein n=1 Tax=Aspergillus thermomutatus TaxID=41047 RepID=A0A397GT35_ASPTH|nr:uncharacterized protein CDV56_103374 [Aspergillus thermomutatus]RHZ53429.1 hypothetical protein CDV56_103374 [Aspergillus thermomutatus]